MSLLGPKYYEQHKLPKWNIQPSVLRAREGRLTRRVFPELSKADHERLAEKFARKAGVARVRYHKAARAAVKRYGDTERIVSGAYAEHFPERTKDLLRKLSREANDFTDASIAHYAATGKRTPWRDTPLASLARIA